MTNLLTLPTPVPLRGADTGSFAAHTVKERLPSIAQRVLDDNDLLPTAVARMKELIADIPHANIRPLADGGPDSAQWQTHIKLHRHHDWLTVPWFFAETYFYRRIIEAVDYFTTSLDPFQVQKQHNLTDNMAGVAHLAATVAEALPAGWQRSSFRHLLIQDLWGNQSDLSMWAPDDEDQPGHTDTNSQHEHILVDNTATAADWLGATTTAVSRIDFLIDNAGFELVGDLALADYMLSTDKVTAVHFHLKMHPTFVSDATTGDVVKTLTQLAGEADLATANMANRLQTHLRNGRLQLQSHSFWTSPLPMWQLPADLKTNLAQAQLLISKGDANYRRLLGDAHWPFTTPFATIVNYLPAALVALRTLKSEVAAGLTQSQINRVSAKDNQWLTNGRWGLIQFAES